MNQMREALEMMVRHFAGTGESQGRPILYTGGLTVLEEAFEALGWDDPCYLTEEEEEAICCEVVGCYERSTNISRWGDLYLRLCSDHGRDCWGGEMRPQIKLRAIKKEADREALVCCNPTATELGANK